MNRYQTLINKCSRIFLGIFWSEKITNKKLCQLAGMKKVERILRKSKWYTLRKKQTFNKTSVSIFSCRKEEGWKAKAFVEVELEETRQANHDMMRNQSKGDFFEEDWRVFVGRTWAENWAKRQRGRREEENKLCLPVPRVSYSTTIIGTKTFKYHLGISRTNWCYALKQKNSSIFTCGLVYSAKITTRRKRTR